MVEYPPFIRGGRLYTPYWRTYEPGDKAYCINADAWYVCIETCTRLECLTEYCSEPAEGKSPAELGFNDPDYRLYNSPKWKECAAPVMHEPQGEAHA